MSQSIHFARINYFSEEFTEDHQYDEILKELKKIFKEKKEEQQEKIIVDIETEYLILSGYNPEIEKFLKGDSELLLHPESRYYFVTEELWQVLQEEIFKQNKDVEKAVDFFALARDCREIEKYYNKKMLVFEVS